MGTSPTASSPNKIGVFIKRLFFLSPALAIVAAPPLSLYFLRVLCISVIAVISATNDPCCHAIHVSTIEIHRMEVSPILSVIVGFVGTMGIFIRHTNCQIRISYTEYQSVYLF